MVHAKAAVSSGSGPGPSRALVRLFGDPPIGFTSVQQLAGGTLRLRHNSLPGRYYDLQVSGNLKDWTSLGSSQADG